MLLFLQVLIIVLLGVTEADNSSGTWLVKVGEIDKELLKIQAIVIKDEEIPGCKISSRNDLRFSNKRYLMCAGSIVTPHYVLTSASCIHEAMHIRHNIRAPLGVMIAPFLPTAQVIQVTGYSIHPNHIVNPKDPNHSLHNIATLKLSCRIWKKNFAAIDLPTQPYYEQCSEEPCKVSVSKENAAMSYAMFEISTDDIGLLKVIETERTSNEKVKRSNKDNLNKRVVRTTFGMRGCPQTGSALMANRTQAGIVSISCDDRQPEGSWQYTDLYDNLDWLNEALGLSKGNLKQSSGCSSCVYNFFFDQNCKNKSGCQDNQRVESDTSNIKISNLMGHKCSGNHSHSESQDGQHHVNDTRFIDSIYELYLNRHLHPNEKEMLYKSKRTNNNETVKQRLSDDFNTSANNEKRNATNEKTPVLVYKGNQADLNSNYSKVKVTYDNDNKPREYTDGNEDQQKENRDYQPLYIQIKKYSVVKSDEKSDANLKLPTDGGNKKDLITKEFAKLYEKFLQEQKQSMEKVNNNVVRRAK